MWSTATRPDQSGLYRNFVCQRKPLVSTSRDYSGNLFPQTEFFVFAVFLSEKAGEFIKLFRPVKVYISFSASRMRFFTNSPFLDCSFVKYTIPGSSCDSPNLE